MDAVQDQSNLVKKGSKNIKKMNNFSIYSPSLPRTAPRVTQDERFLFIFGKRSRECFRVADMIIVPLREASTGIGKLSIDF